MPVIGAIPIVIPTLMKICASKANAIPAAAMAANASRERDHLDRPPDTSR
jgi:hypothetical protein